VNKVGWIVFAVVAVVILGGLVFLSQNSRVNIDVSDRDAFAIQGATEASGNISDHVFGNKDSKVVLIEYADFQCPGCASAYPRVQSIIEEYGDDIAIVTRNYAFQQPHGMAAAAAAEAAGLQGKYKEMAEVLFANQQAWATLSAAERDERFAEYARNLGLDEEKFKTDRASDEVRHKIQFDKALGNKVGVSGTPSFFLNGEKIETSTIHDEDAFRKLVEDNL